jgi:hypothetical protein
MIHDPHPYTSADTSLAEGCVRLSDLLMPIDQREMEDPDALFEQIRFYFSQALEALSDRAFEPVQVGVEETSFGQFPLYEKRVVDQQAMLDLDWLKNRLNGLEAIQDVPDPLTGDSIMLIIEGYRKRCALQLAEEAMLITAEPNFDAEHA